MNGAWVLEQPRSSMLPWHPRVMELWSKLHKVNVWIKGVSGNPHEYYVYKIKEDVFHQQLIFAKKCYI
jgi:hypothetical protein